MKIMTWDAALWLERTSSMVPTDSISCIAIIIIDFVIKLVIDLDHIQSAWPPNKKDSPHKHLGDRLGERLRPKTRCLGDQKGKAWTAGLPSCAKTLLWQ